MVERIREYIKNNQYDLCLIPDIEIIRKERIKFFWGKDSLDNIAHYQIDWIGTDLDKLNFREAMQKLKLFVKIL